MASVEHRLLKQDVGYIKVKSFAQRTTQEVRSALADLKTQGAKRYVLDLRWNPGGLLEQAIQMSDLFVDRGTIVTTVGGDDREPRTASSRKTVTNAPVAVLVNQNSASASEIVAGALKNLDRAVIIGSTTFGKGSVQILYNMNNSSKLKLTIAEYLTPGDLSIQGLGIQPDIELQRLFVPKNDSESSEWLRLMKARNRYAEKDLKSTIRSEYAKTIKDSGPQSKIAFLYEEPAKKKSESRSPEDIETYEPDADVFEEDFEIRFARRLVAESGKTNRSEFLKNTKDEIVSVQDDEAKKLEAKLKTLGVDWSKPPSGAKVSTLRGQFILDKPVNEIQAGENVKLTGTIINTGASNAYRVQARIKSQNRSFDEREFVFGKIGPGESRSWTTSIKIPADAPNRMDPLKFDVREALGAEHVTPALKVRVLEQAKPVFAYRHHLIDEGNGDGLLQAGEPYRLRITIKNTGDGISKRTRAVLRNASGVDLHLKKARFVLDEMKPGEEKTVEFSFETRPRLAQQEMKIELSVYDSLLEESVSEKLRYPVYAEPVELKAKNGALTLSSKASVHEGASASSNTLAYVDKGSNLLLRAESKDWYKVNIGDGRFGFIKKTFANRTKKKTSPQTIEPLWQVTPPKLTMQIQSYETQEDNYRLLGQASDDRQIEDVYVFVSNREQKVSNKKVYYRSNRGAASTADLSFDANLPLWPGANEVTIVARENDDVQTVRTLFLYRNESKAPSSVAQQASEITTQSKTSE